MEKGVDHVGITVSFYCHDGMGSFVLHKRGENCRDEHGCWDFGGGALRHGETLEKCLFREVEEEYGVVPIEYEYMGHDEVFREHNGRKTHWIGFRYKVRVDREKVINNEPEKHGETGWFTLDDLPRPLHSQLDAQLTKYSTILRNDLTKSQELNTKD